MTIRNVLVVVFLVLSASILTVCSNQQFPDCCDADGFRDTPFKTTNLFGFKTGIRDVRLATSDTSGYLFIITAADLMTLLNAANSRVTSDTGVVTGTLLFEGDPVREVKILPTDATGRHLESEINTEILTTGTDGTEAVPLFVRNLFYNNLGRVPDFTIPGTNEGGGFTIFNVEPGEVFIWASEGARGNGHMSVFANEVSIASFDFIPTTRSDVKLFGRIREKITTNSEEDLPSGSSVVFLGYLDNFEFHSGREGVFEQGILSEEKNGTTVESLVEVLLPTNGEFLARVTQAGFKDTYQKIFTSLPVVKTLAAFQKYTSNVFAVSDEFVEKTSFSIPDAGTGESVKIDIDPNKGIIWGQAQVIGAGPNLTAGQGATIVKVTDLNGDPTGDVVYIDNGFEPVQGNAGTDANGHFVVFNVNPGEVMIRGRAKVASTECSGGLEFLSGGKEILSIAKSVVIDDIALEFIHAEGCQTTLPSLTVKLTGRVLSSGRMPVADSAITFKGLKELSVTSDSQGEFSIDSSVDPESFSPVLANTNFVVKAENSNTTYIKTYNYIKTQTRETDLDIFIMDKAGITVDSSELQLPAIKGRLINYESGLSVEGVSVKAVDMDGKQVGDVYYYDTEGKISTGLTESSGSGDFIIANLPKGKQQGLERRYNIIVTSGGDSGSRIIPTYDDDSITVVPFVVNKVLPKEVTITGAVTDFHNIAIPDATITIVGKPVVIEDPEIEDNGIDEPPVELDTFKSDSSGAFSKAMPTNTKLIFKAEATGCMDTYDYDVPVGVFDSSFDIRCIKEDEVAAYMAQVGLQPIAGTGIIGGQLLFADFGSTVSTPTAGFPSDMIFGFYNLDRFLDIGILSRDDNTLSFYLGQSDGSFVLAPEGTVSLPLQTGSMDVLDVNQDSVSDIVVTAPSDNSVMLLLGRGSGLFFGSPTIHPAAGVISSVGSGDFNENAYPDLVLTDSSSADGNSGLLFLPNNRNGTFSAATGFTTTPTPNGLAVADLNFDGSLDVAVISPLASDNLKVLVGDGQGGFHEGDSDINPVALPVYTVNGIPSGISAGDLNGDGLPELLVMHADTNTLTVLRATKDSSDVIDYPESFSYPIAGLPTSVILSDVNGDSKPDVIVSHTGPSGFSILFGKGDVTLNESVSTRAIGTAVTEVLTADFNNDSKNDIALLDSAGNMFHVSYGVDAPLAGVKVRVTGQTGTVLGTPFYFADDGITLNPALDVTSKSGSFLAFNIPQGFTMVESEAGANGNKNFNTTADSLTFVTFTVSTLPPGTVNIEGLTFDPVGPFPGGTAVSGVTIKVLGTDTELVSGVSLSREAGYIFENIRASSEYFLRLEHSSGFASSQ